MSESGAADHTGAGRVVPPGEMTAEETSRIEKQAMRSRGSRREGVKKGKRKKRKKKVWSGGVGGSMVMVQEDEEVT